MTRQTTSPTPQHTPTTTPTTAMPATTTDKAPAGGKEGGLACMAVAMLLLPVGDAFAKVLTGTLDPVVVTMWRFVAQALCLVPVALLLRHRLRGAMFSPIVALSGGLVMITLSCLIGALSVMPIATAIGIFFVEPLILTLLAGPLLGEVVGPRRMTAVAVGFLGAFVVIRPGMSGFGWATVLPLLSALSYALNMIVLRRAGRTRSSLTVQCGAAAYAACGMIAVTLVLQGAGLVRLAPGEMPVTSWLTVAAAGAFAAASFVLIAEAFKRAEAGALAPLQYLEIVGATAAGYVIFGDFPDALTWLGIAIILGSGLYTQRRERRRAPRGRRLLWARGARAGRR
ncbi:DMT family transporter [Mesobaculum littorinae]|nr:DMT family transporter [Mesobaculum littorinae]